MEYLKIFIIFFKVGLFTIGGGLSALPLLQNEAITRGWVSQSEFADMIAISQSTPGPIGINMATYVGFEQLGVFGSIVATLGMVAPSIIIICLIAKWLHHFNDNKIVRNAFSGLRPAVIGIILAAAYSIAKIALFDVDAFKESAQITSLIDIKPLIMFVGLWIVSNKWKSHPVVYIAIAGALGVAFL